MDDSKLKDILDSHKQIRDWSCSVSALEFVAKLYGLLEIDSFPLRQDEKNQKKGFGEASLQASLGLEGEEGTYDVKSALALIEEETSQGRFPIVSLANLPVIPPDITYHIYVVVLQQSQPTLIDHVNGQVLAKGKEDLTKVIEHNSQGNLERSTIHVQTLRPCQ